MAVKKKAKKTHWTPREQAAHRRKWVKALRSGKYEQATGALKDSNGFCCLGVACDISGLGEWKPWGSFKVIDPFTGKMNEHSTTLPTSVRDWLGLSSTSGDYTSKTLGPRSLVDDNDGPLNRRTFRGIAQIIEREPKGLVGKPEED